MHQIELLIDSMREEIVVSQSGVWCYQWSRYGFKQGWRYVHLFRHNTRVWQTDGRTVLL